MKELNLEGCTLLACAIAKLRGEEYRRVYYMHIIDPRHNPYNNVDYNEKCLKSPPTCLDDGYIRSLQMEVEKRSKVILLKRKIIRYYWNLGQTPDEISKYTGISKIIIKTWIKEFNRNGSRYLYLS